MAAAYPLSPSDEQQLRHWISAHGTPQQVALRCRIVLAHNEGRSDSSIAEELSVNRKTAILWRNRFAEQRLDGLWEIAPGRGRKPTYSRRKIAAVVKATLQTKPPGMTHWSCRSLAKSQGIGKSTVNAIWQAHKLQPHRAETFKLSRDPKFLDKLTDVVGLYLNPPEQALVLCVDEKSQIQSLDRTQPGLPLKKGRCGTMTHDYKRNGTTTLFAALETLQGKVIGRCYRRHRHQEFLKFLRTLDEEFPGEVPLHLVIDNYGTHKHAQVQSWLQRHPRFVLHFVPTSSSWLNLVERWFRELDDKAIRRGVFPSVEDLEAAIKHFWPRGTTTRSRSCGRLP
jgi:transposase